MPMPRSFPRPSLSALKSRPHHCPRWRPVGIQANCSARSPWRRLAERRARRNAHCPDGLPAYERSTMRRRYGDAGHLSYTKLVDLTPRSLGFGADVLAARAERARNHRPAGIAGPVAIMVLPDQFQRQAAMFEALATTAARPLKALSNHQAAAIGWTPCAPVRRCAAYKVRGACGPAI